MFLNAAVHSLDVIEDGYDIQLEWGTNVVGVHTTNYSLARLIIS